MKKPIPLDLEPAAWPALPGIYFLLGIGPNPTKEEYLNAWEKKFAPVREGRLHDVFAEAVEAQRRATGQPFQRVWDSCKQNLGYLLIWNDAMAAQGAQPNSAEPAGPTTVTDLKAKMAAMKKEHASLIHRDPAIEAEFQGRLDRVQKQIDQLQGK